MSPETCLLFQTGHFLLILGFWLAFSKNIFLQFYGTTLHLVLLFLPLKIILLFLLAMLNSWFTRWLLESAVLWQARNKPLQLWIISVTVPHSCYDMQIKAKWHQLNNHIEKTLKKLNSSTMQKAGKEGQKETDMLIKVPSILQSNLAALPSTTSMSRIVLVKYGFTWGFSSATSSRKASGEEGRDS